MHLVTEDPILQIPDWKILRINDSFIQHVNCRRGTKVKGEPTFKDLKYISQLKCLKSLWTLLETNIFNIMKQKNLNTDNKYYNVF